MSQSDTEILLEDRTSSVSDARLVEDVRRGDQDSFRLLVERYESRLYRVIYRFVRDDSLAEDLAQEAFIRAYENLDQFDLSRRFGPWLFRIGVNLTLDYLRKRKRRGWTSLFSEVNPDQPLNPGTSDPRDNLDINEEVSRVMQELPEKYRSVLVLRDLENFSTAEIAAIIGRKEATIRWRLAEARNRFKVAWIKRMGDPANGSEMETQDESDSE
ncbi:RNA polymerase sigma factor [Rubinisphaera margarita]|uniref:RNA polymerase sigma factor n=1 Tax=Rubinisphaera margarita TaxID=2909586 RepID=UPI001EE7E81E|nr:sigma-70 family RNA polymerase sigma factor [Rubinisphaera margarita]MCG6156098.1 sigma-70 family RNA polymerase sigma factor [Rubinisphaera margarita]